MAEPPLSTDDPAYAEMLSEIGSDLCHLFRTNEGCGLAVPGASRSGIEAALASLIEPGDRVLVGVYGHFGELLRTLAGRYGAVVERVDADWGRCVEPQQLVERIRQVRPKVVAVVHADTSTGILQPLEEIGQACRAVGSLFLVDAVLSMGGCSLLAESWNIDAAVGGVQKCLGGPPGIAPLVLSQRAIGQLRYGQSYLDLSRLLQAWREPGGSEQPTPMLYALRSAVRLVLAEGLERRWQRHARASAALRAGLLAMGLELFADELHRVPMITLVRVPPGTDEAGVRAQLLEQHGVEIMAAFGPLRGQVWRIGAMGTNACLPAVLQVLSALEAVLASRGFALPRGAAADAAVAVWA